jgi:hypothetical protein
VPTVNEWAIPLLAYYRLKCRTVAAMNPHYLPGEVCEHAFDLTKREHQRRQRVAEDGK